MTDKPSEVLDIKATALGLVAGIMRKHMKWGNTMRTIRELNAVIQFGQEAQDGNSLLSMLQQPPQPKTNDTVALITLTNTVNELAKKVDQLSK
jgi:hypothetical protein